MKLSIPESDTVTAWHLIKPQDVDLPNQTSSLQLPDSGCGSTRLKSVEQVSNYATLADDRGHCYDVSFPDIGVTLSELSSGRPVGL